MLLFTLAVTFTVYKFSISLSKLTGVYTHTHTHTHTHSDKLRQCLGIGREEYPVYIYRMRELGYPPGYRLLECEATLRMYENSSNGKRSKVGLGLLGLLPVKLVSSFLGLATPPLIPFTIRCDWIQTPCPDD